MIGEVAVARPRRSDIVAFVRQTDACQAMPAQRDRVGAEPREFANRPRGECVTARFVSGDRSLLDDGDVVADAGEPGGNRCPGGTTADNEDVGVQGGPSSAGRG